MLFPFNGEKNSLFDVMYIGNLEITDSLLEHNHDEDIKMARKPVWVARGMGYYYSKTIPQLLQSTLLRRLSSPCPLTSSSQLQYLRQTPIKYTEYIYIHKTPTAATPTKETAGRNRPIISTPGYQIHSSLAPRAFTISLVC
jgi:hypothetical protein